MLSSASFDPSIALLSSRRFLLSLMSPCDWATAALTSCDTSWEGRQSWPSCCEDSWQWRQVRISQRRQKMSRLSL